LVVRFADVETRRYRSQALPHDPASIDESGGAKPVDNVDNASALPQVPRTTVKKRLINESKVSTMYPVYFVNDPSGRTPAVCTAKSLLTPRRRSSAKRVRLVLIREQMYGALPPLSPLGSADGSVMTASLRPDKAWPYSREEP